MEAWQRTNVLAQCYGLAKRGKGALSQVELCFSDSLGLQATKFEIELKLGDEAIPLPLDCPGRTIKRILCRWP